MYQCRLSSVVEHFHGKEGVSGSNPEDGSIFVINIILTWLLDNFKMLMLGMNKNTFLKYNILYRYFKTSADHRGFFYFIFIDKSVKIVKYG